MMKCSNEIMPKHGTDDESRFVSLVLSIKFPIHNERLAKKACAAIEIMTLMSVRRRFRSSVLLATLHSTSKRACRRRSLSISRAAFQTSNGREIQCEKGISPVIRRCVGNRDENRFYETAGQRKNGHVETSLSIQANLYEFISDDVIRDARGGDAATAVQLRALERI